MDAQQLGHVFEAGLHKAFGFLCTDEGFQHVELRTDLVRYESAAVFFEVGYSVNCDHEVYSRIGRIGFPGVDGQPVERLDFGLLLGIADPGAAAEFRRAVPYAIAESEPQIRCALSYFATGLRAHGRILLAGEAGAYERAREVRFWHAPDFPPEALQPPPDACGGGSGNQRRAEPGAAPDTAG